jgi:regulator of nucleoside diphosphate kinase
MITETQLILCKSDFDLLKRHVQNIRHAATVEGRTAARLAAELEQSNIVEDAQEIPADVIRLYSRVTIDFTEKGQTLHIQLVPPSQANLSQNRISILTPLGMALIGYRQGQTISWEMPAGKKTVYIKEVQSEGI